MQQPNVGFRFEDCEGKERVGPPGGLRSAVPRTSDLSDLREREAECQAVEEGGFALTSPQAADLKWMCARLPLRRIGPMGSQALSAWP